jgi:hypothetical protein
MNTLMYCVLWWHVGLGCIIHSCVLLTMHADSINASRWFLFGVSLVMSLALMVVSILLAIDVLKRLELRCEISSEDDSSPST